MASLASRRVASQARGALQASSLPATTPQLLTAPAVFDSAPPLPPPAAVARPLHPVVAVVAEEIDDVRLAIFEPRAQARELAALHPIVPVVRLPPSQFPLANAS